MAKKKNRKLRFVISSILSFCLAIFMTTATLLVGIKIGFLSENSVLTGMSKKDYYKGAKENFYQDAKDYTIPVGLPVEVVDDIVDSETVYEDIKGYVTASVKGMEFVFDTEELQNRLTENIYDYFREENLEMNEEQIVTVPKYTQMIADIYVDNMEVEFVELLGKVNKTLGKVVLYAVAGCIAVSAVVCVMLVKMQRWPHRGVRYIVYSSITTVIFVLTPAIVGGIGQSNMKPNIAQENLYYAAMNYFTGALKIFVYLGLGWIAVTAALLVLIKYLKKKSSRRVKK